MEPFSIRYKFTLPDGKEEVFDLELDPESLELIDTGPRELPDWTLLEYQQCPHCPLTNRRHPHCPVARNLVSIVNRFEELLSYHEVRVEVITGERVVTQETTVQQGVSSLMGLIMATSGCPKVAPFKPMARFHLPFASQEETIYRATSMYLLSQYFAWRHGRSVDFGMDGLREIYQNLHMVNHALASRLREASRSDSALNAVVLLDVLAQALPEAIETSLERIEHLFGDGYQKGFEP